MPCSCKKNSVADKRPDDQCIYCAHKHVTTARALYDLELGYRHLNKSDSIGQLILCAWHLQKDHFDLAMKCRECWLKMERFQECREELLKLQESLWRKVEEENEKLEKESNTNIGAAK